MLRSLLTAAALSTVVSAANGAMAQDRTADQRAVDVRHVDFNNPTKVAALYGRIRAAAHAVCTSDANEGPMTTMADKACENDAVRDAVSGFNQPQLADLASRDGIDARQQLAMREDRSRGTR